MKFAEELEIDIPQLWKYIAEFIGPTAFHGNLDLDALFQLVLKYVSKNKAAKFFAHMLQTATNESVSSVYDSGLFYECSNTHCNLFGEIFFRYCVSFGLLCGGSQP